jgi:hypothetical protein
MRLIKSLIIYYILIGKRDITAEIIVGCTRLKKKKTQASGKYIDILIGGKHQMAIFLVPHFPREFIFEPLVFFF